MLQRTRGTLTPREREIAVLVAQGMPTKRIAVELGISPSTVEAHISHASQRLEGDGSPRHRLLCFVLSGKATD